MRKFVVLAAVVYSGLSWAACENDVSQPAFPAPPQGNKIIFKNGEPVAGNFPIITWLNGDGIGPEVSKAAREILDHAVKLAYKGEREARWYSIPVGHEAAKFYGDALPSQTVDKIREYRVSIKGPLETPVGKGARSLNVRLRQIFDLYACIRPVQHMPNVPSPILHPENVNMTIFRENTEDIYSGIEFDAGTPEAAELQKFINSLLLKRDGINANLLSERAFSLGIKPVSEFGTKRLVRRAIEFALKHGEDSVTIVHKANIQKFTDGGFLRWAYEVAAQEYGAQTITEEQLKALNWVMPADKKLVIKDRIIDNMFQQTKLQPQNYKVLVMENLYGDIMSDDLAALVGGLGVAGGINIGGKENNEYLIAEATHGTAPDIAGQNKANPTSLLLSAIMAFDYIKWEKASNLVRSALLKTFEDKVMTGDLARNVPGSTLVGTQEFTEAVKERMTALAQ